MRKFVLVLYLAILLHTCPVYAADDNLPDQAQLTADKMFFDSESGKFTATGNVVIKADGAVFQAPQGTGNVKSKEVHFSEGITASGNWRGDALDLTAGKISFFFSQTPTYIAEGVVKGGLGKLYVDADKLYMKGQDFSALNVRRLEDRQRDIAFGADSVSGLLVDGVVTSLVAQGKVWLNGRPNSGGDAVDIRASKAVYSVDRGTVVLSGSVRAVQRGRVLTASSLVYFPESNRIDAYGGSQGQSGSASITIDMRQERQ